MIDSYINRIKLYFSFSLIFIVAVMFLGITLLGNNPYLTARGAENLIFSVFYRIDYLRSGRSPLGAFLPARVIHKGSAPNVSVLVYHGILKEDDKSGENMTTKKFKEHMFALKREGYETIGTEELFEFMRGERNLPPKAIMITFDDGRRDSFENADPILSALNYKAVMFTISKYSMLENTSYYVGRSELTLMEKTGRWDIEAHTHDGHDLWKINSDGDLGHYYTNLLWRDDLGRIETKEEFESRINFDFKAVKENLSDVIRRDVRGFAFPFGDFGQESINFDDSINVVNKAAGEYFPLLFFQQAPGIRFTSNYFYNSMQNRDWYMIKRFDVESDWSTGDLIRRLRQSEGKSIPYKDDFQENWGWLSAWGEYRLDGGALEIFPKANQTGGAVILDGTGAWKDYSVKATVESKNRSSAFIWVRFKDDNENAACNFGNGYVHIEQTKGGQKRVIKGFRDPRIRIPDGQFDIQARVQGRAIECLLNGEKLVETAFLDSSLDAGGIGFKVWSGTGAPGTLTVSELDVVPL